jgi:hypothetical protein
MFRYSLIPSENSLDDVKTIIDGMKKRLKSAIGTKSVESTDAIALSLFSQGLPGYIRYFDPSIDFLIK